MDKFNGDRILCERRMFEAVREKGLSIIPDWGTSFPSWAWTELEDTPRIPFENVAPIPSPKPSPKPNIGFARNIPVRITYDENKQLDFDPISKGMTLTRAAEIITFEVIREYADFCGVPARELESMHSIQDLRKRCGLSHCFVCLKVRAHYAHWGVGVLCTYAVPKSMKVHTMFMACPDIK